MYRKVYKFLYLIISMTKSINIKMNESLWQELKEYEEINWSGVVRSALVNKIEELDKRKFDKEKAKKAFLDCRILRQNNTFKGKKTGAEIIREWRDRRK